MRPGGKKNEVLACFLWVELDKNLGGNKRCEKWLNELIYEKDILWFLIYWFPNTLIYSSEQSELDHEIRTAMIKKLRIHPNKTAI